MERSTLIVGIDPADGLSFTTISVFNTSEWDGLYKAIADGLCSLGLTAWASHYDVTTENRNRYRTNFVEIKDGGDACIQLFVGKSGDVALKRTGSGHLPLCGPELSDPDFFEKIKTLTHEVHSRLRPPCVPNQRAV